MDDITGSMDMSLSQLWETVKDRKAWSAAVEKNGIQLKNSNKNTLKNLRPVQPASMRDFSDPHLLVFMLASRPLSQ